jgi:hypothetical protein
MASNPRIRRLTLVPYGGADEELRRYRLARMEEIALASPPDPAALGRDRSRNGAARDSDGAATPAAERAPRA